MPEEGSEYSEAILVDPLVVLSCEYCDIIVMVLFLHREAMHRGFIHLQSEMIRQFHIHQVSFLLRWAY